MSDYIVTGKKRNGKSLIVVGKIRDALLAGKRVATNLNIHVEYLLPLTLKKIDLIRLPDYPTLEDMEALGLGYEGDKIDEERNGLIALDEMAQWMNAREFGDKSRMPLLKWFTESGKKRWDCYFIAQGLEQLDKQFRTTLADHHVICKRLDKLRIPFIGPMTKHIFGTELRPPKMHHATVKFGMDVHALKVDSWTYRGVALYKGYDTEQKFDPFYEHGSYSVLSPWHIKGRYGHQGFNLRAWLKAAFIDGFPRPYVPVKAKLPVVALIAKLPPDERMRHYRRFEAAGVLG